MVQGGGLGVGLRVVYIKNYFIHYLTFFLIESSRNLQYSPAF